MTSIHHYPESLTLIFPVHIQPLSGILAPSQLQHSTRCARKRGEQ